MGKTKLWAIVHDGTTNGDNMFECPGSRVPYDEEMYFDDIKLAFLKKLYREGWDCLDGIMRDVKEIKGAWIVDGNGLKMCNAVFKHYPADDDECYSLNRAAKQIAKRVKIKEVKEGVGEPKFKEVGERCSSCIPLKRQGK